jgi:hypothetical protein
MYHRRDKESVPTTRYQGVHIATLKGFSIDHQLHPDKNRDDPDAEEKVDRYECLTGLTLISSSSKLLSLTRSSPTPNSGTNTMNSVRRMAEARLNLLVDSKIQKRSLARCSVEIGLKSLSGKSVSVSRIGIL